jgi:hypothetical protein
MAANEADVDDADMDVSRSAALEQSRMPLRRGVDEHLPQAA